MAVSAYRPRSYAQFQEFVAAAKEYGNKIQTHCINCQMAFSQENVMTSLGWVETQISGMCEKCFDDITSGMDEGT